MPFTRATVRVDHLTSLAWHGDTLVDWLGGSRYALDGTAERFGTGHTYRLDSAVGLEDTAVLYEALGTKGLIVRDNGDRPRPGYVPMGVDITREIDRSFYHAEDFAFPVELFRLPDGRRAIAHCPRGYNVLDIELLEGASLTARPKDSCVDIFYSRLQASRDGRWLLSNGWVWQPYNTICVYEVERALRDPGHLSTRGLEIAFPEEWEWEIESATFVDDGLVVGTNEECVFAVIALAENGTSRLVRTTEPLGTRLMLLDAGHLLAVDDHPRVVELAAGRIVEKLEQIDTGPGIHQPSVSMQRWEPPWVACDTLHRRIAVGLADSVEVLTWTP